MRQIIVMHGIGDHAADFHKDWKDVLEHELHDIRFDVTPLHWGDIQDKIADRNAVVSERLSRIAARIGIGADEGFRGSDASVLIQKYVMDVFAYSLLHNMRYVIQTECLRRLKKLAKGREKDTVIVAHSMGCAVSTHIAQLEKRVTGAIPYRGLVLLAPPLGIRSPVEIVPDPLAVTPDSSVSTNLTGRLDDALALAGQVAESGDDAEIEWAIAHDSVDEQPPESERNKILKQVCRNWRTVGRDALHFCINKNDIVCSDVRFELEDGERDLISIKQGFDADERKIIAKRGHFHEFEFGERKLEQVASNHDVLTYLKQPEVVDAVRGLLVEDNEEVES